MSRTRAKYNGRNMYKKRTKWNNTTGKTRPWKSVVAELSAIKLDDDGDIGRVCVNIATLSLQQHGNCLKVALQ